MIKYLKRGDTMEKNLTPATDKEIQDAIDKAYAELEDEIKEMFSDEVIDEEYGEFMEEFDKATTIEERTAVMDKFNINYQI